MFPYAVIRLSHFPPGFDPENGQGLITGPDAEGGRCPYLLRA